MYKKQGGELKIKWPDFNKNNIISKDQYKNL